MEKPIRHIKPTEETEQIPVYASPKEACPSIVNEDIDVEALPVYASPREACEAFHRELREQQIREGSAVTMPMKRIPRQDDKQK